MTMPNLRLVRRIHGSMQRYLHCNVQATAHSIGAQSRATRIHEITAYVFRIVRWRLLLIACVNAVDQRRADQLQRQLRAMQEQIPQQGSYWYGPAVDDTLLRVAVHLATDTRGYASAVGGQKNTTRSQGVRTHGEW